MENRFKRNDVNNIHSDFAEIEELPGYIQEEVSSTLKSIREVDKRNIYWIKLWILKDDKEKWGLQMFWLEKPFGKQDKYAWWFNKSEAKLQASKNNSFVLELSEQSLEYFYSLISESLTNGNAEAMGSRSRSRDSMENGQKPKGHDDLVRKVYTLPKRDDRKAYRDKSFK